MRLLKFTSLLAIFLLTVGLSMARQNQFGVADTQKISFGEPVKVGEVVLPKGEDKVQHTMEGENHVMVFSQLHASNPATVRVNSKWVPLKPKGPPSKLLNGLSKATT